MSAMDYFPGVSTFHRLDPRTKMILIVFYLYASISISDPIHLGLLYLSIFILAWINGLPNTRLINFVKSIRIIIIIYFVTNIFFLSPNLENVRNIIFLYINPSLKWLPIKSQSLIYSFATLFRFLIILNSFQLFLMTTPIKDLVLALVKSKFPPKMGISLSIGFAYVPVLVNSIRTIMEAQKSRAWVGYEQGNPIQRIKALIPLFIPVITHLLERGENIAVAIEARGFGYNIEKRTYLREISFKLNDILMIIISALGILGTYFYLQLGYGTLKYTLSIIGWI